MAGAWTKAGAQDWLAWLVCVLFGGGVRLAYGMVFGPPLARRDPLVKAVATLGLTLVLFGLMDLLWTTNGGPSPAITLPPAKGGLTGAPVSGALTHGCWRAAAPSPRVVTG